MVVSSPISEREEFLSIRLLTEEQLSKELCVDRITLWRWRTEGMPYLVLGSRSVRYRLMDVQEWLKVREVVPRAA